MDNLGVFIPRDRYQALTQQQTLPTQAHGAALFADIAGFTPLADAIALAFGQQRGAEEITRTLNQVYAVLLAEIDKYGGSVVGFSGDAITCWFDDHPIQPLVAEPTVEIAWPSGGQRAVTCAWAMQQAMAPFAGLTLPTGQAVALTMKVAVATGSAQRFVVGDPAIQLIDVLAGSTLDRLAATEQAAQRGEVVLDPQASLALGSLVRVNQWRTDMATNQPVAVVGELLAPVAPSPWPGLTLGLDVIHMRPWLLPPIYERARSAQADFLVELRPVVALFLRFGGLAYDQDAAATVQLDQYMQWIQGVLARYDAYVIQLTIGDKGSFLYAPFGAPVAHENDALRAVSAAQELRSPPSEMDFIDSIQIGLAYGRMRVGPYGGPHRRTYGVIGSTANLAARLMQAAGRGEVMATQDLAAMTAQRFAWSRLPAITVKGKAEPVAVCALQTSDEQAPRPLAVPGYALPLVGRDAELAVIDEKLALARQGQGQIIALTGEAGIGKSRLVAEVIQRARFHGFSVLGGECQSHGMYTPYLVWRTIWHGFFDLDAATPIQAQVAALEAALTRLKPGLAQRLPLLGVPLNLPIPDNDLTRTFDTKLRKESLEALLVDCVKARAGTEPLLLVIEDSHWLDALSNDLLEAIGRVAADLSLLIVLTARPLTVDHAPALRVTQLPHCLNIALTEFTAQEAVAFIKLKLEQVDAGDGEIDQALTDQITTRTQGNPFYIEELLNYLHDRQLNPRDPQVWATLDLPDSLHSLLLSRMDQLAESERVTLKVASIIGRHFRFRWLWGVHAELGPVEQIRTDLDKLTRLDLTRLEQPEPELSYLFKHILTQEVAYASQAYAARAVLHGHLAHYIEVTYADRLAQYLDLLAFHYERSVNEAKKRKYLRRAGEAAQAAYANAAAISYYQRLLPLLSDSERIPVSLQLGAVLLLIGDWALADSVYQAALALADQHAGPALQARCHQAIGLLRMKQSQFAEALDWLARARAAFEALGDLQALSQTLGTIGDVYERQGEYAAARRVLTDSVALSREQGDQAGLAVALKTLSTLAWRQGDFVSAETLGRESLALWQAQGDKRGAVTVLNNLGIVAYQQGNYASAVAHLQQSLALQREIGDKSALANALNNLGLIAYDQGDLDLAQTRHEESLALRRELGDRRGMSMSLHNLGLIANHQGTYDEAESLFSRSLDLTRALGDKWQISNALVNLGHVAVACHDYVAAHAYYVESLTIRQDLDDQGGMVECLEGFARLLTAQGQPVAAASLLGIAEAVREAIGAPLVPSERVVYDQLIAALQSMLGQADLDAARQHGQQQSLNQVVTDLLQTT